MSTRHTAGAIHPQSVLPVSQTAELASRYKRMAEMAGELTGFARDLRDRTLAQLEGTITAFNEAALAVENAKGGEFAVPSTCWWMVWDHVELLRAVVMELDSRNAACDKVGGSDHG